MNPDTFAAYSQQILAAVQAGQLDWQRFQWTDLARAMGKSETAVAASVKRIFGSFEAFYALGVKRRDAVAENKQQLLAMASKGAKPKKGTHLYNALYLYTGVSSPYYDPIFTQKYRQLIPKRVTPPHAEIKKQLLDMASKGQLVRRKTKLGYSLGHYTEPAGGGYDHVFTQRYRKLIPNRVSVAVENKRKLLNMHRKGLRVKCNTNLGRALNRYTSPANGSYDPIFTQKYRKLRPKKVAPPPAENKQRLLAMASKGQRVKRTTTLGHALGNYMTESSPYYDPIFTHKYRQLIPKRVKLPPAETKRQLLDMVSKGQRVEWRTMMGRALSRYITASTSSYDPVFTKQYRQLIPKRA
jgi:hypothetical protein